MSPAEALEAAGSEVLALTNVWLDHRDQPEGQEAKRRLLALKTKAREELADEAARRGTHREVVAVLDAWLAREFPGEAISVRGRASFADESLGKDPGPSVERARWPDRSTLHKRLKEAIGELAPSWYGSDITIHRPGRNKDIPVVLEFIFSPKLGLWKTYSSNSLSGRKLTFRAPLVDLSLVSRYPDGRTVTTELGTMTLRDDFSFDLSGKTTGFEAQKTAAYHAANSLARRIPSTMLRELGLVPPESAAP